MVLLRMFLQKKRYNVNAFEKYLKNAFHLLKKIHVNLNQKPENFHIENEQYLSHLKNDSLDVIIGLGFLRYLNKDAQDFVYKNVPFNFKASTSSVDIRISI